MVNIYDHIATPDRTHCEISVASFNASKHVFMEKPVGTNLEEMHRIVTAAKNAGTIFEVGYVLRYSPFYESIKEMIESGEIGRPLFANMLEQYYGGVHFFRGWWKDQKANPIMVQKICHDFDLLYWMFGKPKQIVTFENQMDFKPGGWDSDALSCDTCTNHCAYFAQPNKVRGWSNECVYNSPHTIPDNAQILIQFENGLNCTLGMNFFCAHEQSDRFWHIIGSKAEIKGDLESQTLQLYPRHDESHTQSKALQLSPPIGGHGGGDPIQTKNFLDAVFEGREARAGIESAYWSSILVLGAQLSANESRIVQFKELTEKYPLS
jgi:predicted dehydrogenase